MVRHTTGVSKALVLYVTAIAVILSPSQFARGEKVPSWIRVYGANWEEKEKSKFTDVVRSDAYEKVQRELDRNVTGMRRRLPSVLTVGCAKCGTGAVHYFLSINSHLKPVGFESNFMAFFDRYTSGYDEYRKIMPPSTQDQITIDRGTFYLTTPGMRERILAMNPKMKLLVAVCDPVKRQISHYVHGLATTNTRLEDATSFRDRFFDLDGNLYGNRLRYRYDENIEPWMEFVRRGQVHFIDGTNMKKDPIGEMNMVEDFLGVPREISEETVTFSKTKGFFCKVVNGEESCMASRRGRPHPDVADKYIQKIHKYYMPHIKRLNEMVGRNFSWIPNA